MLTRNQLKPRIDFDEASRAWNQNKKKIDNGCYVYICGHKLKNGKTCQKQVKNISKCSLHK